jgi:hypothetical protein
MTSSQKKLLRYCVSTALTPFILIGFPIYKLYQFVFNKRVIKGKYKDIVEGFSYLVVEDSEVEKKAKERASVCSECRFAKYSGKMNVFVADNKTVKVRGMYCSVCTCSLSGLVRSDKACPIGKWR